MARPKHVSHDIIDQILSCLTVKSLVRFKHVSKFINSEPSHVPASVSLRFPPLTTPDINDHVQFFGSCHGLVCLGTGNHRHVVLWDPSTGDSKTLPDYYNIIPVPAIWNCFGGLGYVPSSDDYKVLLSDGSLFLIFSLRKNSWRRVRVRYGLRLRTNGRGMLHRLPVPYLEEVNLYKASLFRVGERLCFACMKPLTHDHVIEFWVVKKYCVKESWTKIHRVPKFDQWIRFWNSFFCISGSKDFRTLAGTRHQITTDDGMFCNDPSRCGGGSARGHPHRWEAIAYTESLVSPHLGN
ncbi:hypothetical protein QQP08_014677 [Theobroma cacao]|nr:hypothetical protein QQP08_014677 [Theobroma cacao]